ncbi:MAG TPA: diguanylate cyclase, partial [Candidatus Aquilonibacter sp.]|nr:diguanylate cyclase [Candidatus Aquilonibacter sp.]
ARIRLANGTIVTVDGGTAIPFQRRSVPITDPTIALPQGLPNPAIIDLDVHAEDVRFAQPDLETNYPPNPDPVPEAFYLLTIGLLTGIALYHLMLYLALRDTNIGLYVMYLAAFIFYEFVASGLGWKYLWPFASIAAVAMLRIAAVIVVFAVIAFARRFMHTRRHAPLTDGALIASACFILLATVAGTIAPSLAAIASLASDGGILLAIVLCSALTIACVRKGERSATFFLIGFAGLFVGSVAKIVGDDFGLISSTVHFYGIEAGVSFDAVVLAFGLADRIARERAERERAQALAAEQQRLARTDALTGVSNRRLFDERLQAEWSRATRHSSPLAILMIDIDRFKSYNDMRGHLSGDDCLKLVSMACRNNVQRADEVFARYGGEEFAVILPGSTLRDGEAMAHAMVRSVRDLDIPHPLGGVITISVGIAAYEGGPHADVDVIVADADAALYSAKAAGGNSAFASATFSL